MVDSDESELMAGKGKSGAAAVPNDEDFEWDDYCYECQDGGNVMCCESCP
mgnify:CR=1 FL=1